MISSICTTPRYPAQLSLSGIPSIMDWSATRIGSSGAAPTGRNIIHHYSYYSNPQSHGLEMFAEREKNPAHEVHLHTLCWMCSTGSLPTGDFVSDHPSPWPSGRCWTSPKPIFLSSTEQGDLIVQFALTAPKPSQWLISGSRLGSVWLRVYSRSPLWLCCVYIVTVLLSRARLWSAPE